MFDRPRLKPITANGRIYGHGQQLAQLRLSAIAAALVAPHEADQESRQQRRSRERAGTYWPSRRRPARNSSLPTPKVQVAGPRSPFLHVVVLTPPDARIEVSYHYTKGLRRKTQWGAR